MARIRIVDYQSDNLHGIQQDIQSGFHTTLEVQVLQVIELNKIIFYINFKLTTMFVEFIEEKENLGKLTNTKKLRRKIAKKNVLKNVFILKVKVLPRCGIKSRSNISDTLN